MTKDGEIILCHDEIFERICDCQFVVKNHQKVLETKFKDLPMLKK